MTGEEERDGRVAGGTGRDARLSTRPRWEPATRGLAVLVIGVVALAYPDLTAGDLKTVFATMVFVEGIFHVVGGLRVKASNPQWPLMVMGGAFSLCLGMLVLGWWEDLGVDLLIAVAYWGVVLGTVHAVFAARAGLGSRAALLFVAGAVGIGLGLVALLTVDGAAMDMLGQVGVGALAIGVLLLALGGSLGALEG